MTDRCLYDILVAYLDLRVGTIATLRRWEGRKSVQQQDSTGKRYR